uniref:Uncharacterized protein n=1 Tax=Octopus bimaculoides TaxID=37653 RepID=A0A0L8I353_OCTBM
MNFGSHFQIYLVGTQLFSGGAVYVLTPIPSRFIIYLLLYSPIIGFSREKRWRKM